VKGNVSDIEKQQYDKFECCRNFRVDQFFIRGQRLSHWCKNQFFITSVTAKQIDISDINGQYLGTSFNGAGEINNLLNYVLQNKPLQVQALNVSADKMNLNDWMGTSADTAATGTAAAPFAVPANLDIALKRK
jgi:hypothetical protein